MQKHTIANKQVQNGPPTPHRWRYLHWAMIYQFDADGIKETVYQDTEHYQLTRSFLDNPGAYFRHLMEG